MTSIAYGIDHIVYSTDDLLGTVERIAALTGVKADQGGVHDIGTANYLLALTKNGVRTGTYLEIIGVHPDRTEPISVNNFGLQQLSAPHTATFCIPLDESHERANVINSAQGTDRTPVNQQRTTPTGEVLAWTLIPPVPGLALSLIPFAINWGNTPHPSGTITAEVELDGIEAFTPDAESLAQTYTKLGVTVPVNKADSEAFSLTLSGPLGSVSL